ncbi:MAG TPA: glycosyltransferase [Actinomycetota bacterium]|nr:glycosyltransferase [Actinomycetota bacterium]
MTGRLGAIHQFLPTFADRDAIGSHVLETQRLIRSLGLASEIYSEDIHPEMRSKAHRFEALAAATGGSTTGLLYHASTGCRNFDSLLAWGGPFFVDYHNITDPAFFERWSPGASDNMRLARRQLAQLAPRCDVAIAHSHFSAEELAALGFPAPSVVPILLDFAHLDAAPDRRRLARLKRAGGKVRSSTGERSLTSGAQWLYVGRVAPNKCHHDLIGAFAVYRAAFDPQARLSLVGGATSESYWAALESLCRELELRASVEFADTISPGDLLAYYRCADLFVSMSEHEGFGVPLLEAMHAGIPVVAHAATAVPETVGEAALLLDTKDPVAVAVAARRVLGDPELRASLVKAGHARVEELSLANTRRMMLDALRQFVDA